jgi:eukaryotic-like serine/threonine-protein kinase
MAAELQTLGRYQLERVLGKGAMGVVYAAHDPKLDRKVAVKTILKSNLDPDTAREYSRRFEREALAVARLNHPNIVQVFDFGEEGDVAYIVMEFIRGRELKSFFESNENFSQKQAVRIMCELLSALDFAHEAGIIHRDIKPANVMLDAQSHVKLTDFGVARLTDADRAQSERTAAGTMIGTPAYMSPEQVQGLQIDRRTDIFSAGVILYQFLTNTRPFTGTGAWTVAKKIVQEDPPVPSTINVSLVPEFDRVVFKALAKDPDKRYLTAGRFAEALQRALEGKPDSDTEQAGPGGRMQGMGEIIDITGETRLPPMQPRSEPAPVATAAAGADDEVDLEFWLSVKDSDDPDDYALYIEQFPNGAYVKMAQSKMEELRAGGGTGSSD